MSAYTPRPPLQDAIEINATNWGDGFAQLERLIRGMFGQVENPALQPQQWQATVSVLQELHQEHFVNQSAPQGEKWPALKPYTIAKKGHSVILIETSDLVASLSDPTHHYAVRQYENQQLTFGTRRPHAATHQYGSGDIPQREHVGLGDNQLTFVQEVMADTAVEMMFEYRV